MSSSNISLYIKRAELFQNKEYIINVFQKHQYGEVHDVKFIKKTNSTTGEEYNGAIVYFNSWFKNSNVENLFDQINISPDATAKILYNSNHGNRYWVVSKFIEPTTKDSSKICDSLLPNPLLSDQIRIEQFEKLVNAMSAQMHVMKLEQDKNEKKILDMEYKEIHSALLIAELKLQLEEKDCEFQTEISSELTNAKLQILDLTYQLETTKFELEEKKIECEQLHEELYEEKNILEYFHNQAKEMRQMLDLAEKPIKGKMVIEELI